MIGDAIEVCAVEGGILASVGCPGRLVRSPTVSLWLEIGLKALAEMVAVLYGGTNVLLALVSNVTLASVTAVSESK